MPSTGEFTFRGWERSGKGPARYGVSAPATAAIRCGDCSSDSSHDASGRRVFDGETHGERHNDDTPVWERGIRGPDGSACGPAMTKIATAVFRRFVRRLSRWPADALSPGCATALDVEGVVLSAYKSFFIRNNRGDFSPEGWDDLWAILALITIRKCGKRRGLAAARGCGPRSEATAAHRRRRHSRPYADTRGDGRRARTGGALARRIRTSRTSNHRDELAGLECTGDGGSPEPVRKHGPARAALRRDRLSRWLECEESPSLRTIATSAD